MSRSRRQEDGDRGSPPVRSLESLWAEYGAWLERYAATALGGDRDGEVGAVCYLTMVEAGRRILDGEFPRSASNLWPWFEGLADDACRRVRAGDVDEGEVPAAPLPAALPAPLRAAVRRRQMREWLDWRFGKFAGALVPVVLERARQSVSRGARDLWRRAGAPAPPGAPGATATLSAAFGSGVSEAAAAAAAVVILGLGGGTADAAPGVTDVAPRAVSSVGAIHEIDPGDDERTDPFAAGSVDEAASEQQVDLPDGQPRHGADPLDRPDEPQAPAPPVVEAKASERVREPASSEQHDGGTEWTVNHDPATGDLEGDGESDLTVQPPVVFVDCVEGDEPGPVTSAACTVAEDGGLE